MKYIFLFLNLFIVSSCASVDVSKTTTKHYAQDTQNIDPQVANIVVTAEVPQEYIEPKPPYWVSLQTLINQDFTGSNLVLEQVLNQNAAYTRYRISYQANGLNLSGIMNIPTGDGPFPLLILNHGYIDPAIYTNGRGLKREQDYMARNGFAVIHPDYRNHAFSDKDEQSNLKFRLGYTEDVIGAVLAAQNSKLSQLATIDTKNVGMLGHSMGGGITQNILVVRPDLVKAAVLYAPVSSSAVDNLNQYYISRGERSDRVQELYQNHGSPQDNPEFWENISPKNFFHLVQSPVKIFIGTNDDSTPPQWSYDIKDQLESAGKQVELVVYEGERHEYGPKWGDFMKHSADFFTQYLK
jgi:dipeptidyl aminopeptidase/acylaminoacyl peptidase